MLWRQKQANACFVLFLQSWWRTPKVKSIDKASLLMAACLPMLLYIVYSSQVVMCFPFLSLQFYILPKTITCSNNKKLLWYSPQHWAATYYSYQVLCIHACTQIFKSNCYSPFPMHSNKIRHTRNTINIDMMTCCLLLIHPRAKMFMYFSTVISNSEPLLASCSWQPFASHTSYTCTIHDTQN